MSIHFNPITPDNWRVFNSLKVKEHQKKFVASNVTILAKAYAYRNYNSRVHGIYSHDVPIGMIMQREFVKNEKLYCVLDQFMIDEEYQGKGYGKTAMELWLSMIKKEEKYESIFLCYIEGDEPARNLYLNMGFHHTGEVDEDEITMEYKLKNIG
ncbi:GNAT family N-acetyltransferase [Clostridium sp.]|uniref:GNAT family N-acetyltransferase n=1 Tax=Clostridium sp. TaxID=1506 RepID=UPI002FC8AAB4